MKTYLIPIIISAIVIMSYFSISQTVLQEQSLSKQCTIPYDVNFIEQRAITSSSDGKPRYSIQEEFSIFHTVPIGQFSVDEVTHSLILKPVPASHGYIVMCNPLPILEKRFDKHMDGLFILVDGEEIKPNLVNDVLRIDVNNNTRIEITEDFRLIEK
jgi:hypothetical protein